MSIFSKLFPSYNSRKVDNSRKIVSQINTHYEKLIIHINIKQKQQLGLVAVNEYIIVLSENRNY